MYGQCKEAQIISRLGLNGYEKCLLSVRVKGEPQDMVCVSYQSGSYWIQWMELVREAWDWGYTHLSPDSVELASQGQQKPCKKIQTPTSLGGWLHDSYCYMDM